LKSVTFHPARGDHERSDDQSSETIVLKRLLEEALDLRPVFSDSEPPVRDGSATRATFHELVSDDLLAPARRIPLREDRTEKDQRMSQPQLRVLSLTRFTMANSIHP